MRAENILSSEGWTKETRVIITGRREVLIEGHTGLFSYESGQIRIRSQDGIWTISGNHMMIEFFGVHDLLIRGNVESVSVRGEST